MLHTARKLVAGIAVASAGSLCATDGCTVAADAFLQGLDQGYQAETGRSIFDDLLGGSDVDPNAGMSDWDFQEWDYDCSEEGIW